MTDIESEDTPHQRVFLIRHAEATEGDKDPDLGRHLTELGKRQAQALANRLAGWQLDAIFCSDMYRSCETAAAIAAHHPDIACVSDPVFREVSAGAIERDLEASDGSLHTRL